MNKELAINLLRGSVLRTNEQLHEAVFMAIRALKAEPVKHGSWIKNEGRSGWHCSYCGKDDLYAYPYTENNERELQDFYCPNCGAKMDGVIEDE